jgi:hypothetical protein
VQLTAISTELKRNQQVYSALLKGTSREEYSWKPDPGRWCLLEVVCHLYDEEREDFRARIKHVLENPAHPMAPIDPPAWVIDRKYLQQDYETVVNNFLKEREKSVAWLDSLKSTAWVNVHHHPKLGPMTAPMLLDNWLAHDYLHFRQITRLKYGWLDQHSEQDLSYAGNW